MRPVLLTALAAFALPAPPLAAQAPATSAPAATPTTASSYVIMAGASDLYEIQSSQMALQKSQNAAIRQFAQMMIDNHSMTTEQVTAAARTAGLEPMPPVLQDAQARMLSQLQPLNGAAFDAAYLNQQRTAHQMALTLHGNYARNGDNGALKQVAAGAGPVVQRHIEQLQGMNAG